MLEYVTEIKFIYLINLSSIGGWNTEWIKEEPKSLEESPLLKSKFHRVKVATKVWIII